MIEDKAAMIDRIAEFILEDMDLRCLHTLAYESLYASLDELSETELESQYGAFQEQDFLDVEEVKS